MIRHDWSIEELSELYELPLLELIQKAADIHNQYHPKNEVQIAHLISVRTGGCVEDCKYCAQSSYYKTFIKPEPMMELKEVLARAKEAKEYGASRICLGAAWRNVRNNPQFEQVLKMVSAVCEMGLEVCCTLGMLDQEQALRLKEAGLYAYSHNLDTSDRFYPTIITTRTYQDRLDTIAQVRSAKVTVCCGGIIGLGEKKEDRLRLLQTLSSFTPHPESVPINRLSPVKGTPLGEELEISVWELVRMVAVCRIAMPETMVRLSAGREKMTIAEQALCFLAGANSFHWGKKLLTVPNQTADQDAQMLEILKLKPQKAYAKAAQ